jgi:hypothetical protein
MSETKTKVVNVRRTKVYDLFIGRPSALGSPFVIGRDGNRAVCLAKYAYLFLTYPGVAGIAAKLAGKTLGCFCSPRPCHGHILAQVADGTWDPELSPSPGETADDYVDWLIQNPDWPAILLEG